MNHSYFTQIYHYQKEYDIEVNCVQNLHFDCLNESYKEQNVINTYHKSTSFETNIKKHRTKLKLQSSFINKGSKLSQNIFSRQKNPTESTQADQKQIYNPINFQKSPKRKIKNLQTGFQLIKKQKNLMKQILKSMGLEQNIKVFDRNYSNIRLYQQLQSYNKVNFQFIMKLIYYQGFQLQHLEKFLEITFKKVGSVKIFFDILLEETYQFGNVLNQNLNLIIQKKILNAKKNKSRIKNKFQYFKNFSKLYKTFFEVFDIIFQHFQYILQVYKQIEIITEVYQQKQNKDFNTPQIKFGQHIKNTLLKSTFTENHILQFLLEAEYYFFSNQNFYSKKVDFYFKYQLNKILQFIQQAKYHQEKIMEENSDYNDKDEEDMYDDEDSLSFIQIQLEEERQIQEFNKQQKRKEKRKRKKQKQREKKKKEQIQNKIKEQEELCQRSQSIFQRIDKEYRNILLQKIKVKLNFKNFKINNYFNKI